MPKIIASDIKSYEDLKYLNKTLWIKLPKNLSITLKDVEKILIEHKGTTPVIVYDEEKKLKFNLNSTHWVNICDSLENKLKNILNENCIVIK